MAGIHLVVESYVDHDHFSNHADPAGAAGVVGVHTTPEPHLGKQQSGESDNQEAFKMNCCCLNALQHYMQLLKHYGYY